MSAIAQASVHAAPPFARGADSVADLHAVNAPSSAHGTHPNAPRPSSETFDFVCRYLGSIKPAELEATLAAGLAFMPVTYGGWKPTSGGAGALLAHDHSLALTALGINPETNHAAVDLTVWLDLEGLTSGSTSIPTLIGFVNAWADGMISRQLCPGIYVGEGHLLTSDELHHLRVIRYWKGASRLLDRNGQIAEPAAGWSLIQLQPGNHVLGNGIEVDVDVVQKDYKGRTPNWLKTG